MFRSELLKFLTNVSLDSYQSKSDAKACLSSRGAKAIDKDKMSFKKQKVSVDEFLQYATAGHAFCNLFDYDPNKQYWSMSKDGMWRLQYPEYRRGSQKGGMKLSMKCDRFFRGAQTVFVDIDNTRFGEIPDYLSKLTKPPTCVYMSYSDKKDKGGVISRRFRMVYVFDRILGKDEFIHVSRAITNQIVIDTGEPMDDDCGTRMSQYMNGVYGNDETYRTYNFYSVLDFPVVPTPPVCCTTTAPAVQRPAISITFAPPNQMPAVCSTATVAPAQPGAVFDRNLVNDMRSLSPDQLKYNYSWKYSYKYRTEKPEWIDNQYQLTDDNHLQLWWYREKQIDGEHRRRKLFKNACLRRLMFPDMTPDEALYNLYLDSHKFFDNSDGELTVDMLIRKVKNAFEKSREELEEYCCGDIQYWKEHRPQFIIRPGCQCNWGVINDITHRIRLANFTYEYNRSVSIQENIENGIGIPESTLYRYCNAANIDTNPNKGETEHERRERKRQEKQERIRKFLSLYDPAIGIRPNKSQLKANGLSLSKDTISKWAKKYFDVSSTYPVINPYEDYDVDAGDFPENPEL